MTTTLTILAILLLLLAGCWASWAVMIRMPGKSHKGPLPDRTAEECQIEERMRWTLEILSEGTGERNLHRRFEALLESARFIESSLHELDYKVERQEFKVQGKTVSNLWVESRGSTRPDELILIGSHYDTVDGSPGANDNGSAVAANLEMARAFREKETDRTVRFAFFVNEEYPYFMTPGMGSLVHAKSCKSKGEKIIGMLNLETIGCYLDGPETQKYPSPLDYLYPSTGNFITFVGNLGSRKWVHQVISSFRSHTPFPSEGIAATEFVTDIRRSDHYPFWREGYPALMVTDTANFRYAHYHQPTDTIEHINFDGLSRVVAGLIRVTEEISRVSSEE